MSFTVASFAITAFLCYGIYCITMWHWKRRRFYKMASKFEGPSVLPFIGNTHLFIGTTEHILSKVNDLCNSHPSLFRIWLGPVLFIFVTNPEHIKTICNSSQTLAKGKLFTDFTQIGIGTGIFTAPVQKWKVHRKLIQPTFNSKILDSFVAIFSAQSKILTEQMEPNLGGLEFEVFEMISKCTLDIICETAIGVKMGAQIDRNCYFVKALPQVMAGIFKRICSPWLHPDFIFNHTQIGRDQKKYMNYFHEVTTNVIKLKKKQLFERNNQPGTNDEEYDSCESISERKAFLDHLMTLSKDGPSLSDKELHEEVNTMVAVANDTNANASTHVMRVLAAYPDVQEKVYQELFDIYGKDDIEEHPVTSKDLPRMKYLECVIKETLRLFPPGPYLVREVEDDLKIGEHTLPKGSTVVLGIMSLHRNEKYWPDPLKFDPERFLPEEIAKRHPYAFMGFSGGPRNCIGYNFAMMSMKTLLATVLRKFVLKIDNAVPIKDIRWKIEITLKPVDPIKIIIERRTAKIDSHCYNTQHEPFC